MKKILMRVRGLCVMGLKRSEAPNEHGGIYNFCPALSSDSGPNISEDFTGSEKIINMPPSASSGEAEERPITPLEPPNPVLK
jgi:hypothetical protein